jgi:hypothetical protein
VMYSARSVAVTLRDLPGYRRCRRVWPAPHRGG